MNSTTQTALQMGMEYSEELTNSYKAHERLTGHAPQPDGDFWDSPRISSLETLSAFWWGVHRINNPFGDGTCDMEDSYEENRD